jgi:hypothetical protein
METTNLTPDFALYALRNGLTVALDRLHPDPKICYQGKIVDLETKQEVQSLKLSNDWYLYHDTYDFYNAKAFLSQGKAVRRLSWPAYMYIYVADNILYYGEYGTSNVQVAQLSWTDIAASDWHTYDTLESF